MREIEFMERAQQCDTLITQLQNIERGKFGLDVYEKCLFSISTFGFGAPKSMFGVLQRIQNQCKYSFQFELDCAIVNLYYCVCVWFFCTFPKKCQSIFKYR